MADIRLVSDSDKLELGGRDGGDLNLYHNSTNSFIENETGILYVTNKANTSLILGTNNTIKYADNLKLKIFKSLKIFGKKGDDFRETINYILNRTK